MAADVHATNLVEDDVGPGIGEVQCPLRHQAGAVTWSADVAMLFQDDDIEGGAGEVACHSATCRSRAHDEGIVRPMGHRRPSLL
jgi:hypothetical protein